MNDVAKRSALLRACGLRETDVEGALDFAAELLECITDAFVFVDREWRVRYVNGRAGELIGRAPEALVGRHVSAELPEAVGSAFQRALEEAAREQKLVQVEAYFAPWKRWLEARVHPSKDGLAIFFQDVSERHRRDEDAERLAAANLAREQSETWLGIALDASTMGLWDWEIGTNEVRWSPGVERVFGLDKGAFAGTYEAYLALLPEPDRAEVVAAIEMALAGGSSYEVEHRVVWPGGTIRWVAGRGRVYRDAEGRPTRMAGAVLDITDQRRAESERRELALLVEAATDFIGIASLEGSLLYVNSAGRSMVGIDEQEVAALRVGDLLTPEGLRRSLEVELPAVLHAGSWSGDTQLVHRKTKKLIDVMTTSFVIQDPETRVPIAVATVRHDVGERRELEGQLRQSQKMEAIGRLAAGVAHDFNNLLTVIGCMTGLVVRERTPGAANMYLRESQATVERAAMLTRQLLSFSRPRALDPQVHDLSFVVTETANLLSRLLPSDITLEVDLAPVGVPVFADRGQLEQILLNLVVNARDAMPKGGLLTIQTRDDGDHVVMTVTDTGTGMSDEVKARIFEPFFTTKEAGRGTGLGMATVQAITKDLSATIDVESTVGRGSTISVRFQKSYEPLGQPSPMPADFSRRAAGETILVVEGDTAVRSTIRQILEAEGYRVLDTATPENALRIAKSHGAIVRLLVTELHMPKTSGLELAEQIRGDWPGLKVLYVSGDAEDSLPHSSVRAASGAPSSDPCLKKPFNADALARKVHDVLTSPSRRAQ